MYTLYIFLGMIERSLSAVKNLKKICKKYLSDEYEIKVIDLSTSSQQATKNQILAIPTLIEDLPTLLSRLISDLFNIKHMLKNLKIKQES